MNQKKWYEFGGPGDVYSFLADNDKLALMACLFISPQGMMVFHEPENISVPSPAAITLSGKSDKILKEIFPDMDKFIIENEKNLLEILKTCMIGSIGDRKELENNLTMVMPEKKDHFIEHYKERKRTSLMNLHPRIDGLILEFEKRIEKRKAGAGNATTKK